MKYFCVLISAPRRQNPSPGQPQTQYMPVRTISQTGQKLSQEPVQRPVPAPRKRPPAKAQPATPLVSAFSTQELETASPAQHLAFLADLRSRLEQLCCNLAPQEAKYNVIKDILRLVCPLNAKYEVISLLELLHENKVSVFDY